MPRWEPGSRERLQAAALELFTERGYDTTTVGDISDRAGVAKRTFFRYFPDKREVLFAGSEDLQSLLVEEIGRVPDSPPLEMIAAAIAAVDWAAMAPRAYMRQRQDIVATNPELRERELGKYEALSSAFCDALTRRGVEAPAAHLAAQAGITVLRVSFEQFSQAEHDEPMPAIVADVVARLRDTIAV